VRGASSAPGPREQSTPEQEKSRGSSFKNTESTEEPSKDPSESKPPNFESEYFISEDLNPTAKLTRLEKQRNEYRGKWLNNYFHATQI
jgi:hypothetical protein